jgi:hypothetical protein
MELVLSFLLSLFCDLYLYSFHFHYLVLSPVLYLQSFYFIFIKLIYLQVS